VRWKEQLLEVGMAKEWICGLGDFLDERLVIIEIIIAGGVIFLIKILCGIQEGDCFY
jgi:hypothetical protein